MSYHPNIHNRKLIRLKEYDYSCPGIYFVTLCTKNRKSYFNNESVRRVADNCWCELSQHFENIKLDEYVVMPDHVHGIIIIRFQGKFNKREPLGFDKSNPYRFCIRNNPMMQPCVTLGGIIRYYKARSTYLIRNFYGLSGFGWQSRYYDRIVWGKSDLERVRDYIRRQNFVR